MATRVLRTGGLKFDGVDDDIYVGDPPSLWLSTFTAMAWIYAYNPSGPQGCILCKGRAYNENYGLFVNGTVRWQFTSGGSYHFIDSTTNVLGKWHFVAGTFDGSYLRLYIDAVKEKEASAANPDMVALPLRIGARNTGNTPELWFRGLIGEVRIYNRALSASEISDIYNYGTVIRDGLVLLLDFTEYEGDKAYDKSGCGNHGTIYGAEWVIKKAKRVVST